MAKISHHHHHPPNDTIPSFTVHISERRTLSPLLMRENQNPLSTRAYITHTRASSFLAYAFSITFSLFRFLFHKTLRFLRTTVYALGFPNLEVIREDHFRALKVLY